MNQELSETRRADRLRMAVKVKELAESLGCTAQLEVPSWATPSQCQQVRIQAPGGLCLNLDFDKKSVTPNVHVLNWHMDLHADNKLRPAVFGGAVNPYHYRKATQVAAGFDELVRTLTAVLSHCRDGTAYQAQELAAA